MAPQILGSSIVSFMPIENGLKVKKKLFMKRKGDIIDTLQKQMPSIAGATGIQEFF